MYTILLILLLIDCFALVVAVLLQAGKGGGLAAGFGGAGTGMEMMGSRQTATFLHTATKWLGGAFLVICFALSLLTVRGTAPRSLIESEMQGQQPAAPADAPGEVPDRPLQPATRGHRELLLDEHEPVADLAFRPEGDAAFVLHPPLEPDDALLPVPLVGGNAQDAGDRVVAQRVAPVEVGTGREQPADQVGQDLVPLEHR